MTEDIYAIPDEQGWSTETLLDIAIRWISDLGLLDDFNGELERIAAAENGTEWEPS